MKDRCICFHRLTSHDAKRTGNPCRMKDCKCKSFSPSHHPLAEVPRKKLLAALRRQNPDMRLLGAILADVIDVLEVHAKAIGTIGEKEYAEHCARVDEVLG